MPEDARIKGGTLLSKLLKELEARATLSDPDRPDPCKKPVVV
jgi:hypothetical protein